MTPILPYGANDKHKAFTLVELLIVIIIIGALSGMMMLGADAMFGKSKATRCLNDRKILEREYMLKKLDNMNLSADAILKEVVENHNGTYSGNTITGICPTEGVYSCDLSDNDRMIKISCSEHNDSGAAEAASLPSGWVEGTSYAVGDTMVSGGYIFSCLRAHTSGNGQHTRDPATGSNKQTWEVIRSVDGSVLSYSSSFRYATGTEVIYQGKTYKRTAYDPSGGQTPFENSDSRYWILK